MKPFVFAAVMFVAASADAGITYDFSSTTTGLSNQTVEGAVRADGRNIRIEVTKGDGMLFDDGGIVVSTDGGQTMTVLNPSAKTWYTLRLSDMLGGSEAMLKQLGAAIDLEVRDPKVSITGGDAAGTMEGFAAKKSTVTTAYDVSITGLSQPMNMTMNIHSDVWWTDELSAELTNFLQMRGLRTGIEAVDKLIVAQSNAIKGFPLKQVTTTTVSLGGRDMKTSTTSIVRNVKRTSVPASSFAVPSGFSKTNSPIEKMFGKR